jgi:hypothetical protein
MELPVYSRSKLLGLYILTGSFETSLHTPQPPAQRHPGGPLALSPAGPGSPLSDAIANCCRGPRSRLRCCDRSRDGSAHLPTARSGKGSSRALRAAIAEAGAIIMVGPAAPRRERSANRHCDAGGRANIRWRSARADDPPRSRTSAAATARASKHATAVRIAAG